MNSSMIWQSLDIEKTSFASSADCEREFSLTHTITHKIKNRLEECHLRRYALRVKSY